jgi:parallel beta-helix repeat protein
VTRTIPKNLGVPFYTTNDNPRQPENGCIDMHAGNNCEISWSVNATGPLESSYEFNVLFEPTTYSAFVAPNETKKVNITITDALTYCQTLSQPNKVYYLANDVSSGATCFNITADNITLNGQGYTITYGTDDVATVYYGVYATHKYGLKNITIKNLKINTTRIARDRRGIYLYEADNSTIINVDASVNNNGIYLYKSNNNILTNVTANNNTYAGILNYKSYNAILSNIVTNNNTYGILLNSSGTINLNNGVAYNNTDYGIYLFNSSYDNITNSKIWGAVVPLPTPTPSPTPTPYYDVHLQGSSSNNDIFLNVSYDFESINSGSNLTRKWYLDVYVNDAGGIALGSVLIKCWNITNALIFQESTGEGGSITTQNLTEYINRGGARNFWTNYTINASKTGYIQQTRKVNLTTNKFEVFTLLPA